MGTCPCPRCLVQKPSINKLGTPEDAEVRLSKARVDDSDRKAKVAKARTLIYDKGKGIASVPVEDLLKPQSLVPTTVRTVVVRPSF